METRWKSITSCPKRTEGGMRETTCNCCIDIVTIRKQPGRLVAQVRMTHATLLRSRMNGNVQVRFCSRVEVATHRLSTTVVVVTPHVVCSANIGPCLGASGATWTKRGYAPRAAVWPAPAARRGAASRTHSAAPQPSRDFEGCQAAPWGTRQDCF